MQATKAVEATSEFDMLPAPSRPRVVQMHFIGGAHTVLMSDGRMFERVGDPSKASQPFGPHWTWKEIKGPEV